MPLQQWVQNTLTRPLFRLGEDNISLLWIIQVLGLLLLVSLLTRGIKRFLKYSLLLKLGISESNREVIATLSSLSLGVFGYILILQGMGLDLTSLAVIIGGLGVGIGFGLQELTKNLVSGLTLLAENKLKVGDLIEFNDQLGYIKEISIRSTVIRTFKGSELIVPNTDLTSNTVENWNYENCQGRIDIPISVDYGSDLLLVTEVLLESAATEQDILADPPPKVIFKGFNESDLLFELWVWVARIDRRQLIKSSLNYRIEYHFRQRGIKIPFPQREVSIRNLHELMPLMKGEAINTFTESQSHSPPTLKELLQQFSCFSSLDDLQLRSLIEKGIRRQISNGETLIQQGEYSQYFFIVLVGEMIAIYENQKISQRLFTFKSGQYFGELPLLLEVPYPTSMIATQDTTLFLVSKECFRQLLLEYPHLSEDIANELAKRQEVIQDYQEKLKEMGLLESENIKNPVDWIRQRIGQIFRLNELRG